MKIPMYEPVFGRAKKTILGGRTEFRCSIATLSLIDPKLVSLPVMDYVEPGKEIDEEYICGNKNYRFANFLDAKILVDNQGTIIKDKFTEKSGLYRDKSFMKHDSLAYKVKQYKGSQPIMPKVHTNKTSKNHSIRFKLPGTQGRRFVQTVGARTKTSDDIGKQLNLSHLTNNVALPPIWSTLRLTIDAKGNTMAELLYHSLFPSLWFYVQDSNKSTQFKFKGKYDGTLDKLKIWFNNGFGNISKLKIGKNEGNPWQVVNPHVLTK